MANHFKLNSSGILEYSGANNPGWISNLGISYSGGQFKIVDAQGTDLSTTNPGWVTVPSTTQGQMVTLQITAATHLFDDDTAVTSDITGEEFGTTAGVAWGSDRPFFIYLVNQDNTDGNVAFAISPNPCALTSPATANIGYHGNPASTPSDMNFFFLTSTNVTVSHASKPCVLIGCLKMTKSSADDWTVTALDSTAGIGPSPLAKLHSQFYAFPTGQMGAVTNYHFNNTAGTGNPTWATPANIAYHYKLTPTGDVMCSYTTFDAGNATNGSNGNDLWLYLPYKTNQGDPDAGALIYNATGKVRAGASNYVGLAHYTDDDAYFSLEGIASTTLSIACNSFSSATDDMMFSFIYHAF